MDDFININSRAHVHFRDISIHYFGRHCCPPKHTYGPSIRDQYVLHYIHKGKGTFFIHGAQYDLKKGDMFVLLPKISVKLIADEKDPWVYSWVAFDGDISTYTINLLGLNENPVHKSHNPNFFESAFKKMQTFNQSNSLFECLNLQICVMNVLLKMIDESHKNTARFLEENHPAFVADDYVKYAIQYIAQNFMLPSLTVASLANELNINRSHLCKIFKQTTGVTPSDFITNVRIELAKNLLIESDRQIKTIAPACGYADQYYFSRAFVRCCGTTPSKFRKEKRKP